MGTGRRRLSNRAQDLQRLRPALVDVIAPIVVYFGLRALGVGDLPALLAGGGLAAGDAIVSLAFERRLRGLPIFVCCMFALTGGLALATHDPRVVLLKASIAAVAIGLYFLVLVCWPSALGRVLSTMIARGSPERAARWDEAWRSQPSLRRTLRLACLLNSLAIFAEAAARAAIVLSFKIGLSIFLMHAPAVILVVVLLFIVRFLSAPAVARAMADQGQPEN